MSAFDIFNGDADGLCALHQLRLAEPLEATLVTGVKRDVGLVKQVRAGAGDRVTVLDVSFDVNRDAVMALLEAGAHVRYVDHHLPGEVPAHPHLETHLDTAPDVCTSLIVDHLLEGRFRPWAVAAAFGDNLGEAARLAAAPLGLDEARLARLRALGECLNYNGYGETLADLHFHPAALYRAVSAYSDPFAFMAESPDFARLEEGYREDMGRVDNLAPEAEEAGGALYVLPDAPWSRRVSGVFANDLANRAPGRAHAVLTRRSDGAYTVSVRSPKARPTGAATLCKSFPSGGGREAAAGINGLPEGSLDAFARAFFAAYPAPVA